MGPVGRDSSAVTDGEEPAPASDESPSDSALARLPRWMILLCLVLAFRAALLVQQIVVFSGLHAAGCSVSVQTGLASTKITGFEGCEGNAATVAAIIGVFGSLLIAIPLLLGFRRMNGRSDAFADSRRRRALCTFAYLLALAAVAEAVAGAVVLSVLDHGEAAEAVDRGIPLLLFVLAGLAVVALAYPTLKSTARLFVVRFLGHDEAHVPLMEKAVLVKLTFGVAFIAATRMILG